MSADTNTASKQDLISIIVPVYNGERYIKKCADSVRGQTYTQYEAILINDGSTDGSGNICNEYMRSDPRFRVIHTANRGPAAARNKGIELSRGEQIFFLDADDHIEKNALSRLHKVMVTSGADMAVGDFFSVRGGEPGKGHNCILTESRLLEKTDIVDYARMYLKKPNRFLLFAFSWGRLFRSSLIKGNNIRFDESLHTYEDVVFNFEYLNQCKNIYYLKEPLYIHLLHDNFTSATTMFSGDAKKMFGYPKALEKIGRFLISSGSTAEVKKEVGHAYVSLTIIQMVRTCGQINTENRTMISSLIRSFVNSPDLREKIKYYSPTEKDSRIIPLLMKFRLTGLLIWLCWYKAQKRYGKKR